MFEEIDDKSIFKQSQECAFKYLNTVFERNVYPKKSY